jgi:hypothetical protein
MPSIGALTVHRIRDLAGQGPGHDDCFGIRYGNHQEARLECLENRRQVKDCVA